MIFVVGGAFQGKEDYVKRELGEEYKVIKHYHLTVKAQLEMGCEPEHEARKLLEEFSSQGEREKLIIISNEMGYGLVPTEKEERRWREEVGRVNCYLASEADEVIRVVCGIGVRIK